MTNPEDPQENVPAYGTPEYAEWYAERFPEYQHARSDVGIPGMPRDVAPQRQTHRVRKAVLGTFGGIVAMIIVISIVTSSGSDSGRKGNPVAAATTTDAPDVASSSPPTNETSSSPPATKTKTAPEPAKTKTKTAPEPAKTTQAVSKPTKTTPPPPPKPPKPPKPEYETFSDGQHIVGQDIQPGTYRAADAAGCYWERDKDFNGELESILANDNPTGPAVVTILPTDKGFTSDGCGTWTSNLTRISASADSFGDGTWMVGVDIHPGTYRSTAGSDCYWERESDFESNLNSILANDNPSGAAVVTISATDKGFTSSNCGTWTRIA